MKNEWLNSFSFSAFEYSINYYLSHRGQHLVKQVTTDAPSAKASDNRISSKTSIRRDVPREMIYCE